MHLPWTQVANEVIDQAAPQLASALDWHEDLRVAQALALRGLLLFIRWALGQCPTDRPPSASALIPGPGAARLVALQMEYPGDPDELTAAMAAIRPSPLVEVTPEGIRVNGLDRYDSAWRKNFKDEATAWDEAEKRRTSGGQPTRGHPGRKPDGNRSLPARQTQTQTQTQTSHYDQDQIPPPPPRTNAPALRAVVGVEERETASLWEAVQHQREERGYKREGKSHHAPPAYFRAWHVAFRGYGHGDEQALEAHADYLDDRGIRKPGKPTGLFVDDRVWRLRVGPPRDPEPLLPTAPPEPATPAAAAWAGVLAAVSPEERPRPMALGWLQKLRASALVDSMLTVEASDEYLRDWTVEHYGSLVACIAAERGLRVQVRTPGPAPPVPMAAAEVAGHLQVLEGGGAG